MEKINLIAHRGGYKESNTKENSKEAIKYAVSKDYIDGVEFDVRVTKDDKIVLIHNASIKFDNKRYKVSNTSYEKLNDIYLKLYHTKLNTLDEILYIIPKEKLVFLEIKNIESRDEKKHLELIYHTLRKYPTKKIVVISFISRYLKYFSLKGYDTCFLLNIKSRYLRFSMYFSLYLDFYLKIISMNKIMVQKKNCNKILKSNKCLGIYTLNSAKDVDKIFKKIGIEVIRKYQDKIYITTNNPKEIYERIQLLDESN